MIDKNRKTTTLPKDTSEKNTSTESKDPMISLGKKFNSFKQLKNLVNAQQTEPSNQGTKTISVSQPPLKIHRLLETAKEFNIGKERLINFRNDNGFEITNDPGKKLSEAMYKAVSAEFTKDKDAKRRSKLIKLSKTTVEDTFRKLSLDGELKIKKKSPLSVQLPKKVKTVQEKGTREKLDNRKNESTPKTSKKIINGAKGIDLIGYANSHDIDLVLLKKWLIGNGYAQLLTNECVTPKETLKHILEDFKISTQQKPVTSFATSIYKIENVSIIPTTNRIISIEWEDLKFLENGVSIKYRGLWSDKLPVKNAKAYLNTIKAHYKFRGLPKLKVEVNGNTICSILNEEVLFYCILFLESSNIKYSANNDPISFLGRYDVYIKPYYLMHFSELFSPKCFNFLCGISSNTLPFIPVPEKIINGDKIVIHNSFLFPLVKNEQIFWSWESAEELTNKATYIFKSPIEHYKSHLLKISNYLRGDTVNKRETIIQSFELRKHLGLVERIYHSDFHEWKRKVSGYSEYSI